MSVISNTISKVTSSDIVKKATALVPNNGHRALLHIRKASPQILVGAGIVGVAATAVVASRATLKLGAILEYSRSDISILREARGEMPEKDYVRDLAYVYGRTVKDVVKLYTKSVLLGTATVACFLSGHKIMAHRNAALAAAYTVSDAAFRQYRARVVEELGEDQDRLFAHGYSHKTVEETDDKGVTKTNRVASHTDSYPPFSPYARVFCEGNNGWTASPDLTYYALRNHESYLNDRLRVRGHVFLNEVYDYLGFERTREGAVVGWTLNGDGDGRIDFGMYRPENSDRIKDFINGHEKNVWLDFNVDGVIWDLI